MRLLYLANLRLPTEKAYGIQIAKMCEAFVAMAASRSPSPASSSQELRVELIAPHRKSKIKEDFFEYYGVKRNFKFIRVWTPDWYWPGPLERVAVRLKDFISGIILATHGLFSAAEIVYSRDEWPLYWLSFFRRGLIFEAHRFSPARKFFYRRFERTRMKVAVISTGLKKDFLAAGFEDGRLLVAPDGVDLAEFALKLSKEEARNKVSLPLETKIVMYTGHLFEWKGAVLLLEAAKNFQFSIFNFQNKPEKVLFVFVGGTAYDLKKFREKAKGLDNVLILGHKSHKEIPLYLKAADVLVLPNSAKEEISSKYTSPLKLFEYLASGRPIVASDLPSVREILNEQNAVLVKPDDLGSLAEGIKKILDHNILSEKLAQKALKDACQYTWQKRAEKIINFVEN